MLCDDCKKRTACVHITKIINNQKVEKHLCEQCARKTGEINTVFETPFSVHDFLKGMFNTSFEESQPQAEQACTNCGMTYADFSRSGKIGCSYCYETFSQRLQPLVKRIHGTCHHTGKVPARSGGVLALKQQLQRLKQQLQSHIDKEEYEEAAKVRDQIRGLERQLMAEE
jgi:protein arginine kinase activator